MKSNLGKVRRILDSQSASRDEVLAQLDHLRAALVVHFWNEENEGFFDEVRSQAPRLIPQAHKLCAEHQEILQRALELMRFAAAGATSELWWRELQSRFQAFIAELMHHENEENSLLERTLQEESRSA